MVGGGNNVGVCAVQQWPVGHLLISDMHGVGCGGLNEQLCNGVSCGDTGVCSVQQQ